MKPFRNKSFTILESLFATILITLIAVVFFSSIMTSFNHIRHALELRTASLILQEEISLVRELEFSDIQSLGSSFTSGSMSALKDAAGTIVKSAYSGDGKTLKLTLKLSWTSFDTRPLNKTIVTLITDHGIDKR